MSEDVRNGAPYQIIVSFPEQKKDSLVYTFATADEVLTGISTLALVHIKENIRKGNGQRTVFEVIAAPEKEKTGPVIMQSIKVGDTHIVLVAEDEEVEDAGVATESGG